MATELGVGYISLLPSMQGFANRLKQQLGIVDALGNNAGHDMGQSMSQGLTQEMQGAGQQVGVEAGDEASSGFSDKFMSGLKGLGGLVAAAGIGTAIAGALTTGMEREKLGDKLAAQLNLAGPDAERAGQVAGNLYAGAWGDSMEDTHEAVSAVMSSIPGMMDAPKESLEAITATAMDLSTAMDVDVAEATQTVAAMMKNGLAKDATQAFDLITGGMQSVPAQMRGEILPAMQEYSKHWATAGIDGATAMGLIVNASADGAIGIDKIADSVKELGIRAGNVGDKAAMDALGELGLKGSEIAAGFTEGGDAAEASLAKIVHGLQEVEDPTARATLAFDLFGTPLEDLGVHKIPEFLGQIDPAGDAFDTFEGAAKRMGDTLNNNTATAFESLKRGISTGFVDLVGGAAVKVAQLAEALRPMGEWLNEHKDTWGPFAIGIGLVAGAFGAWALASAGTTVATGALAAVMGVLTAPITGIIVGLGLLVGSVIYAYKNIGWFKDGVDAAWERIKVATGFLVDTFKNLGSGTAREFGVIKNAALAVGAWFTGTLVPWFKGAVSNIGDFFSSLNTNVIQPVWGWIKGAISNVVDWFTGTVVPNFEAAVSAVGGFFDFLYRNFIAPFVWLFKMAILAVTDWFRNSVVPRFEKATALIGAAFRWLNEKVIQPVWTWIKNKISAVATWFNTARLVLQARIAALGEAFKRLYNAYVKPVWDWIKSRIQAVGNWFRDVLVPAFRGAIQRVADKFSEFKTRVNTVWEGVKTLLRNGWNWISGNVFDPIKGGLTRLKDAFTGAKNGIGDTWDKLKAKVKEPIAFVVNKVINPFIGGYNDLNNFWSGTDLKKIAGFHAGGYTGPGSKYQPAGVVHADEYVIRKESQNDLSRNAPGLLDNLNKYGSKALGYHTGGLVAGKKHDDPANMAIGARVYGGVQSFTGPMFEAIRRTGELNVAGNVPGWSLDAAIRMADAATSIKVQRGNGNQMNGVTARSRRYGAGWDGYYQGDDGSIMLNEDRNHSAFVKRAITAHELGHALALPHNALMHGGNGARSIMNYDNFAQHGTYTNADVAALSAIFGGSGRAGVNGGSGDGGGIGEWIAEKLKKITTAPIKAAKSAFAGNKFAEMPLGIAEKFITNAIDFAVGGSDSGGPAGEKQVAKWMTQALKMKGMYSETNLQSGIARAMKESGGDPSIIQGVDDVNSRSGNHARGLMQVIPPTFNAFKEPGYDDIFNPIDNILASINYTVKRYGTLAAGWNQPGGYADGGLVKPGNVWDDPVGTVHKLPQGVSSIYNGTGGAEYFQRVDPNRGGDAGLHIHGDVYTVDEAEFASKVFKKIDQRRSLAYVA